MTRPTRDRLGLTGTYAGPISRLLAFALDSAAFTLSFTALSAGLVYMVRLLTPLEIATDRSEWWWSLALIGWAFTYWFVSLLVAGRTAGKVVVGLRVVERDGSPILARAAFVRTVTMPLTFVTLGLGFVGVVIGRERRTLHDVFAGTTVVYDWGDRPAELPAPLSEYLERRRAVPAELTDPRTGA